MSTKTTSKLMAGFLCLVLTTGLFAADPDAPLLKAYKFAQAPTIDGVMDNMWEELPWNSLNYVWMDWEATVDSADYYGQFKIAWSEETNLLYFYVEITDDVLVERYAEEEETNYYNDIVEVFLDEDASGGMHIFDGSTNAENAFSYHMAPLEYPVEGTPATSFEVGDLDGTSWGDSQSEDYTDHFPELVLLKDGDRYVWEFSLMVYTDAYEGEAPDGTESDLEIDKEMGIALAYCETDQTVEYRREMFLGSLPGNADKLDNADGGNLYGYNDTWQNADDYHLLTLENSIDENFVSPQYANSLDDLKIIPDAAEGNIRISFNSDSMSEVEIALYDISGRLLQKTHFPKNSSDFDAVLKCSGMEGTYIAHIYHAGEVNSKLFVTK